ncbi:MAG TPA: NUDIX domain-containing protein [Trueperaceae bacterium]|nr:NUDIX domain-containing protein [Trueperaceae bacterium]
MPTRDWAVSVFVIWREQVLLHRHRKLRLWLPPGGHVEFGELPDEAAVREVLEETGVAVELVGERAVEAPGPVQLVRPRGVQLEAIAPGHEHIDLVYLARPRAGYDGRVAGDEEGLGWYDRRAAHGLGLTAEMAAWVELALAELAQEGSAGGTAGL